MIHEFTLVLDREPAETGLRALAVARLDPIGTEGQHPVLAHLFRRRRRPDLPKITARLPAVRHGCWVCASWSLCDPDLGISCRIAEPAPAELGDGPVGVLAWLGNLGPVAAQPRCRSGEGN